MMVETAASIAICLLVAAQLISLARLIMCKDLPDKVVAVNLIGTITMGIALCFMLTSKDPLYLDVALATVLIVFLGTVMLARYLKREIDDR